MTLNVEWLLVPDGLVWIFKKLLIYWDFQAQPSLGFTENENIAWFDESRFLLRHSDGRFRILNKKHEIMDPSCLVSMVQAAGGGVMLCGIFSWHTLCTLVPIRA